MSPARRRDPLDRPAMPAAPAPAPDPTAPPKPTTRRGDRTRYTLDLDPDHVRQLRDWTHAAEVDRSALFLAFLELAAADPSIRVRVEALARDRMRPRGPRQK